MNYQFLFFLFQNFFGGRDIKEFYGKLIFIKKRTYNLGVIKVSFRIFWEAKKNFIL